MNVMLDAVPFVRVYSSVLLVTTKSDICKCCRTHVNFTSKLTHIASEPAITITRHCQPRRASACCSTEGSIRKARAVFGAELSRSQINHCGTQRRPGLQLFLPHFHVILSGSIHSSPCFRIYCFHEDASRCSSTWTSMAPSGSVR